MESVSCHQKGLVMGNILWSVDKKIYSDKEDHTLAITGWAITRDQSECDFILYGSEKELSVLEPSRCERADVAKDLKETKDIKEVGNVGFTVKIPEIIKLAEEHEKLQLALRAGDEKEIIWEATAAEVKDFCEESLIEYHIDEEQITQESILTVRGWVVNQLEPDEIFVQGTDGRFWNVRSPDKDVRTWKRQRGFPKKRKEIWDSVLLSIWRIQTIRISASVSGEKMYRKFIL